MSGLNWITARGIGTLGWDAVAAVGTWLLAFVTFLFALWTRRDTNAQIKAMRQAAHEQVEAAQESAREQIAATQRATKEHIAAVERSAQEEVAVTERMTHDHIDMLREDLRARLLLHYETLWDSADMIDQRKKLASVLLSYSEYLYPHQSTRFPYDLVTDAVPNFFESVGLLLRRGQLEIEIVYHTFAYYALRYARALGPYIARDRQTLGDEGLWNGFRSLFEALGKHEEAQTKRPSPDFPAAELIRFFREEAQSSPPAAARTLPR